VLAAIDHRELITVAALGHRLRGTWHKAQNGGGDASSKRGGAIRTGILFLNSGADPRTASGDSAVYWADSFAKCGYPSFRIDLPGLGDSGGELPEKWQDFTELVNGGHFSPVIGCAAKSLAQRYNLSGVVLVGHCAGSVSAIYAASASEYVKGVIALDPYFFREEVVRPAIRKGLSELVTRNKVAAKLGKVYGGVKKFRLMVEGNKLPGNANLPLLSCWGHLASAGVPILVLTTGRATPRAGDFDYFRYLQTLSGSGSRMVVESIEGANHSFADDVGREGVRRHVEPWLNVFFPLVAGNGNAFFPSGDLVTGGDRATSHDREGVDADGSKKTAC
jgi:pimeloyl-ACP methyl ester carboxylesterase